MGKIDYKKLLLKLIKDNHHELDKIEKVVIDSRNNSSNNFAYLSFAQIVNDKEWNAQEKERLLRLFGYENTEHDLEYTNKYNNTETMDAAEYMIIFDNLSGFTAYMNCFKDIKSHYRGTYITKDEAYRSILNSINAQTHKKNIATSNIKYPQIFTKEKETEFMRIALSILSEEDKKRLCANHFKAHTLKAVSNESIFVNIIHTEDIKLIDEYIPYIDNISSYLSYAVLTGNISVVKHFLDLGADINYYPKEAIYGLLTPLKTAIANNDYEMVKFLLDNGANADLSIQENDFLDNLHNTSLKIFDRWGHLNFANCKEEDKDVKDLQYLRTSSPLEYAITLRQNYQYEYCYNQYLISFEGNTNYVENTIDIITTPGQHTKEQTRRAKIINLLFDKADKTKGFDATNLICSALVTQDTENINKYIDYIVENKIAVDTSRIFDVFLSLHLDDYKTLTDILISFIKKYSQNSSQYIIELFNIYLAKNIKKNAIAKFSLNDFTYTLLNNISISDRKNIILMPYAKNVETVKELMKLGFDINQTDEYGRNILFMLLGNRIPHNAITTEEKELFKLLTTINPKTNKRLIDIAHRDKHNKNALFYALQKIDTKDEYRYGSKEKVYTYSEFEDVVADLIDMLPITEINTPDIISVLEKRMTEYNSGFGDKIHAEYVYQHHKKLMEALRRKITFSNKIYQEIFKFLYPTNAGDLERLNSKVQVESSLDFVYEVLDRNTKIQKLSIDNNYDNYIKLLTRDNSSFEEFLCIFKKLITDLDELKQFYEQNVARRYNQRKYLDYVKNKYNVSYNDLSSYILRMIIFGLKKYGSDKLPIILELCPGYDINTVIYEQNIGMSYYAYLSDVIHFDDEGFPIEMNGRYEAENVMVDYDGNILFTGSLIHYGILTNDIKLVKYLKSIGANAKLIIEGEDHTWDYVNSNEMADLIEPDVGSRNLVGFTAEEREYLLNLDKK